MTHVSNRICHVPSQSDVIVLVWRGGVSKCPRSEQQLSIGVEVDGANDGRVSSEIIDDMLGL